jgi:hypothetical protein
MALGPQESIPYKDTTSRCDVKDDKERGRRIPNPGGVLTLLLGVCLTQTGAKSVHPRFSEGLLGKKYFSRAGLLSPASSSVANLNNLPSLFSMLEAIWVKVSHRHYQDFNAIHPIVFLEIYGALLRKKEIFVVFGI